MLQGDWGFSFVSRVDVDKLILQRLPTTVAVIGASQILADLRRAARRRACRARKPYSLFDQVANTLRLHRLLAADLLHRPAADPGASPIQLDWLPFVYTAEIAGHRLGLRTGRT
jgi:peptide/nickel transport system permease protein